MIDLDQKYEDMEKERDFSAQFYADLYEKNGLCYDITYIEEDDDDEEEISESFEFLAKYKGYIDDIVYELKSGITEELFDSIQVQLVSGSKD